MPRMYCKVSQDLCGPATSESRSAKHRLGPPRWRLSPFSVSKPAATSLLEASVNLCQKLRINEPSRWTSDTPHVTQNVEYNQLWVNPTCVHDESGRGVSSNELKSLPGRSSANERLAVYRRNDNRLLFEQPHQFGLTVNRECKFAHLPYPFFKQVFTQSRPINSMAFRYDRAALNSAVPDASLAAAPFVRKGAESRFC